MKHTFTTRQMRRFPTEHSTPTNCTEPGFAKSFYSGSHFRQKLPQDFRRQFWHRFYTVVLGRPAASNLGTEFVSSRRRPVFLIPVRNTSMRRGQFEMLLGLRFVGHCQNCRRCHQQRAPGKLCFQDRRGGNRSDGLSKARDAQPRKKHSVDSRRVIVNLHDKSFL